MGLKLHARRSRISNVMVLIVLHVCLTCVWLVFTESGSSDDGLEIMPKSGLRSLQKTSTVQLPIDHRATLFHPTNATSLQRSDKKKGEGQGSREALNRNTTSQGKSTVAPRRELLNNRRVVSKVQVPQSKWLLRVFSKATSYCNKQVELYENMTALMRNVIVDRSKSRTKARGGEKLQDVLLQAENFEYYHLQKGFFEIANCTDMPDSQKLTFNQNKNDHLQLNMLGNILKMSKGLQRAPARESIHEYDGDFVITLVRIEYANVYWTVMDLYDVFLMMQLYNRTFQNTDLWILDAHPDTQLDGLFAGTFRRVIRMSDLSNKTHFRNLLPSFNRAKSPLLMKILRPLNMAGTFRSSVLSAMQIPLKSERDREERCKKMELNVLFIWRRNYVGHPRNPKGIVSRKISNEKELLSGCQQRFSNYTIQGVQLDKLPMKQQLQLIANADIMVGMHGAAFGFTIFMREGSGLLEMWPLGQQGNWHMEYLAKRNGLYYKSWQNKNQLNENRNEKSTIVTVSAVKRKLEELSTSVCSKHKGKS